MKKRLKKQQANEDDIAALAAEYRKQIEDGTFDENISYSWVQPPKPKPSPKKRKKPAKTDDQLALF